MSVELLKEQLEKEKKYLLKVSDVTKLDLNMLINLAMSLEAAIIKKYNKEK